MELHESREMCCEFMIEKVFIVMMPVNKLQNRLMEESVISVIKPLSFSCQCLNQLQDLRDQTYQISRNRFISNHLILCLHLYHSRIDLDLA